MAKRSEFCVDCRKKAVVFYGVGQRCQHHADIFDEALYQKRKEEWKAECEARAAHVCGEDEFSCRDCCEHQFDLSEGGYCINGCELHRTEV